MKSAAHHPPYKILLSICLSWIFGVFVHSFLELPWASCATWIVILSSVFCVALYLWASSRRARLYCLLVPVFALSLFRYDLELGLLPQWVGPPTGSVTYSGTVDSVQGDGVSLKIQGVFLPDGSSPGFPMVVRGALPLKALPGDVISWRCRASPATYDPEEVPDLSLGRSGWSCRVSGVEIVNEGGFSFGRALAVVRGSVRSLVYGMMPPTEAALLMGLLAGERSDLPPDLADAFRDTGTTHILAVSGYNIARVTGAVLIALASLRMLRRRAIGWSAVAVVAFTVFVGCGASVIRAALMGCLALAAARVERRYDSGLGLVVAAAVMLGVSPLSLSHDLGFQLSFAAVLGLRYFGPRLTKTLARFVPAVVAAPLADSLAAVMATAPIILFFFGVLAPVAPLTNVLVAPLVPAAMITGALAAALSFTVPVMAPLFGLLPWLLLKLITTAVTLTAVVPTLSLKLGPVGFAAWSLALVALAHRWNGSARMTRRFL